MWNHGQKSYAVSAGLRPPVGPGAIQGLPVREGERELREVSKATRKHTNLPQRRVSEY